MTACTCVNGCAVMPCKCWCHDGRCPSTSGEARCWYFAGHPGEIHRDMENNLSWGRAFVDPRDQVCPHGLHFGGHYCDRCDDERNSNNDLMSPEEHRG